MRYVDEFRNPEIVKRLTEKIHKVVTRPWTLMEVCGGQTHSILRHGLDQMLPKQVELLHGPGCPVCVTPGDILDDAIQLALQPGFCVATFGDMLRVPGNSGKDLLTAKAEGAHVRIVYSPLDALKLAQSLPELKVVFLAVGFETTAPANAMAVYQAERFGIANFFVLTAQVLVPPALLSILQSPANKVQGFLAAGHVCAVSGYQDYQGIAQRHRVPIVVTGFEPVDILQGVLLCLEQLEAGRFAVENQYSRVVQAQGNLAAQQLIEKVFEVVDQEWRGLGVLPQSGLRLKAAYRHFEARKFLKRESLVKAKRTECQSGLVLQGAIKPSQCPHFGGACNPEHPLGPTMVSGEGACAAYHRYRLSESLGARK